MMLIARSPIDDAELQAALRVARDARDRYQPHQVHPSGRILRYDDPNDSEMAHSLAIGRSNYSNGGAIEREVQAARRFSIPYLPTGLATGVPAAAPVPVAPMRRDNGLDNFISAALDHARMHLAHGGGAFGSNPMLHAMPGSTPLAAAPSARGMLPGGVQPVLSQNLQHGLMHHLLRQRPRFEDGGDANSGDNDSSGAGGVGGFGGNYGSNGDNYGAGYGGFTSAERAQNAADDAADDADPNSWGGGGGSVSRGSQIGGGYSSFSAPSSSIGYGGGDTSGTTMGNAVNAVAGLGSGSAGVGNIGLSGSSMGDGWGGFTSAASANSGLGFGNFGAVGLGDGSGAAYGVNGVGNGWHGLSDGSTAGNVGASYGFQNPDSETTPGSVGNQIGGWDAGPSWSPNTSSFGDLSGVGFGGFTGSDIASAVKAAQGAGGFGDLSGGNFTTPGTAAATHAGLFGSFGNQPAGSAFAGSSALADGDGPGVTGNFGYQNVITGPGGVSIAGSPSEGLGVLGTNGLGAVAGFDNFSPSAEGLSPSMVSSAGFSPSAANGWGLGSGFGSGTGTGDPASADGERSLTVHPGFASGLTTGDEAPSTLSTPDQVRSYAMTDLAKNFGQDYGQQFGLPASFGFSDPNAVQAAITGSLGQESSFDPGAINKSSLAAGLQQMMGAGIYSRNNIGPYSGNASDPAADRESAMLGFLGRQAGVDPSTLDPRAVGADPASAALVGLPGTYNNQLAFGMAQLAQNPMYRSSLAAVSDPTRSIPNVESTFTSNFEGPQDGVNLAARQAAAQQAYNTGVSQMAALGLASPNVVAGVPGGAYAEGASPSAASDPSLSTAIQSQGYAIGPDGYSLSPMTDSIVNMNPSNLKTHIEGDRRNQFAAQQAFSGMPSMVGYDAANNTTGRGPGFSYNDGSEENGLPSTDDSDDGPLHTIGMYLNAAKSVIGGLPSMIFGGSDPEPAAPAAPVTPSYYDTTLPSALAQTGYTLGPRGYGLAAANAPTNSFNNDMGYAPGSNLAPALSAADMVAANGTPSFVAGDIAANALNHNTGEFGVASEMDDGSPSGVTYSDAWGTPAAGSDPAVTSDPSYLPGQKTAIKAALNIATAAVNPLAGIANLVSGLLGGPTVGGFITDHSKSGTVSQAGGASGRDGSGGDATPTYQPGASYSSTSSSSTPTSSSVASSTTPTVSTAQEAYLAALKNLPGPGAKARKSNAVPLVAPTAMPASFYDPLRDPSVLAGLAARGYAV